MTPRQAMQRILLSGPDELLLNIIKNDPECACAYARHMNVRWPEAEEYIKRNPEKAYEYALYVIGNRWPEAEEHIKKNAEYARKYAQCVIRGRWFEAESVIITEPLEAYFYAREIMKKRWKEAEKYIAEIDYPNAFYYLQHVVKGRWVELEQVLLKNKSQRAIVRYCKIINQRWPEAEPLLSHASLINYCNHFSIPLPEENYNRELLDCAINAKSSRYFNKIKKEKEEVVRLLKSLVSRQVISKDQTVEDLIK